MDQLQTSGCFETPVYHISKPDFIEPATEVFNEYVKCQCHKNELYPSIMTGDMLSEERILPLAQYVIDTAYNILEAQGYKMDNKETYFHSMWGQQHGKYGNMEEHVHNDGVQLVGFYFLECPENGPRMIVHDPRPGKVQIDMPEADNKKITRATSAVVFNPKPGDLFFTNSWLPHSFTRNGSETPAKFIHINISVRDAQIKKAIVI